jgi:hypothetical protein
MDIAPSIFRLYSVLKPHADFDIVLYKVVFGFFSSDAVFFSLKGGGIFINEIKHYTIIRVVYA